MRIAVISDVHGNLPALDAVIADARDTAPDEWWILGDLFVFGPNPSAVAHRVDQLAPVVIRGNTDRYLVEYHEEADLFVPPDGAPPHLVPTLAWTRDELSAGAPDWLTLLAELPLDLSFDAAGTSVHLVHASPGTDDGSGLQPGHSDHRLQERVGSVAADVILTGHTHMVMDRHVAGRRLMNPGTVGCPTKDEPWASYLMLELDGGALRAAHRSVPYDHLRVLDDLRATHHPAAAAFEARLN